MKPVDLLKEINAL